MRWARFALWCSVSFPAVLVAAAPPNVTGAWEVVLSKPGAAQSWRLTIDRDGSDYSGSLGAWKLAGRLEAGALRLHCLAVPACGELNLRAAGASLAGEGTLDSLPVQIRGERPRQRPYAEPRSYEYTPREYSGLFTRAAVPVLRIFPGDSVRTRTLDAEGFDERGVRVSAVVNPQTGPFYVEGAMPGDTLEIRFIRIRPNRATADMYGDAIAANALEPYSLRREQKASGGSGAWSLDLTRGTAAVAGRGGRLAHFEVPLRPMLGCVGVAPANDQSLRTVNLGPYGGNLDYGGVHEGAVLYLPVFQRGALLFLGDGHARQGDGELTGTGLETSMDVEFSVDLIRNRALAQPLILDDEFVMVSGIGGSLGDALQRATTGMVDWLAETYQLDAGEIALVLGSSMRYDITEIVDPQIHVVAKLPLIQLATIARVPPSLPQPGVIPPTSR